MYDFHSASVRAPVPAGNATGAGRTIGKNVSIAPPTVGCIAVSILKLSPPPSWIKVGSNPPSND